MRECNRRRLVRRQMFQIKTNRLFVCFVMMMMVLLLIFTQVEARNDNDIMRNESKQISNHISTQSSMLSRVEASIMGESALIDKETGRVYWEGGSSNTLYESVAPKLNQFGAEHAKATALTCLLTLAFVGVLSGWVRKFVENYNPHGGQPFVTNILLPLLEKSFLVFPKLENKWLVTLTILLYLLESYNCNTRRFLANAICNGIELEEFIENLRQEQPIVEWQVRTFHYEKRILFLPKLLVKSLLQRLFFVNKQVTKNHSDEIRQKSPRAFFPLTKKVVTNEATGRYEFGRCDDSTIAGVWKRAESTVLNQAPFTKIVFSKLLILSDQKTREDYFHQQSEFVTSQGRGDEFVEFSTDIKLAGFRPRMLAVRSVNNKNINNNVKGDAAKHFRLSLFWFFTLLGLTVPYRIWFARHCDHLRVTVVKETYAKNENNSSSFSPFQWFPSRAFMQTRSLADEDSLFRSFMQGLSLYTEKRTKDESLQQDEEIIILDDDNVVVDKVVNQDNNTPEQDSTPENNE